MWLERKAETTEDTESDRGSAHRLKNSSRLTDWLLLLAVPAFFFLWKLAAFGLIGADEPRYAQVAREMLARHDWVTPTLGGIPWLEKPPLYYWQAIFAYRLFGVSDWASRLPSVFDAFLLVLAVYCFLRRFRSGLELDGALVVATTAGIAGFARAASMDMPLTASFSIAVLAWYAWFESGDKKYLAAFYGFLGLATLAKGPIAPFLAIAVVVIFAVLQRISKIALKTLWIPGILLGCAVALPWYVLVQLRNPQFFHEFIVEHNLARFGTNLYHHPEPFWYYIPVALLGWVPWSILAIAALVVAVRQLRNPVGDTLRSFLLIWVGVIVIFFSISQSKLPGYVLPAIPAAAILAAGFARARSSPEKNATGMRLVIASAHALLLGALVFAALVIQYFVLEHRVPWNAATVPLAAAIAVAIGIFVLLIQSDFRTLRMSTLVPAIVALAVALRFGAQPLDETLSARPVANELANFDPHHLPIAVFLVPRETEFGLAFYRNQITSRYEFGQIPQGEHLVVAAQGFQKSIAKETGRKIKYLGNFAPQKLEYFYVPSP
jgi:4-amino-4-deoxy-L-arabinose transferase-like glycosyltransferase